MGMAASQARLLTITARMHDVEYQAQSIQNAKIALATKEDQVYQKFLDATNATTLVAKDYQGNLITATFNNLCGVDGGDFVVPNSKNGRYVIFNEHGQLIVPDEIAKAYNEFKNSDCESAYEFAFQLLGIEDYYGSADEYAQQKRVHNSKLDDCLKVMDDIFEKYNINATVDDDEENIFTDYSCFYGEWDFGDIEDEEDYEKFMEAFEIYENIMYSNYYSDMQQDSDGDMDSVPQETLDYYVRMFQQIEAAGGCVAISDYNGIEGIGNAASDADWLKGMISCGKFTIFISEKDSKTGAISFRATSVASDSGLEEVATTTIDKSAYAKAEAEYEHEMKKIDQKDKRFDMDLSKLETERNALKTEYDSVKKVVEDNIERTFGIFS